MHNTFLLMNQPNTFRKFKLSNLGEKESFLLLNWTINKYELCCGIPQWF